MPIRVPSTFYLNIYNTVVGEGSKQRLAQQKIDQPPQYFFSADLDIMKNFRYDSPPDYASLGVNGTVKMQIAPIAKNQI